MSAQGPSGLLPMRARHAGGTGCLVAGAYVHEATIVLDADGSAYVEEIEVV